MEQSGIGNARETIVVSSDDVGGSDHRLIYTKILNTGMDEETGETEEAETQKQEQFNLKLLSECQEAYIDNLRVGCREIMESSQEAVDKILETGYEAQRGLIESLSVRIKNTITTAARATVGTRKESRRMRPLLRDGKFRDARRERRSLFKRLGKDPNDETLATRYREARRAQHEARREAVERTFWGFGDKVEAMADTERSKLIAAMVRRKTRGRTSWLASDRESLDAYADFLSDSFRGKIST